MAPTLLFDKSFLQSLSVDEAAVLDQFYRCIICPIFWVETLADLSKSSGDRAPEEIVRGLAERTPVAQSAIATSHWDIVPEVLLGRPAPMDGRPMISGGRPVRVEGQDGIVFENSPEQEAFSRWQDGRFDEVERRFARVWREQLAGTDLTVLSEAMKGALKKEDRPRSKEEAREQSRRIIAAGGNNYRQLQIALTLSETPTDLQKIIIRRWKAKGSPPLKEYAPYITFCLELDLFFYLCLSNGLISDQRSSNLVDLSYLYYLPFAQGFVSNDKLHRSIAPLFLRKNQFFCWGPELKADLRRLDEKLWALPEEERAQGLFTLAKQPPEQDEGIIAQHWDKAVRGWRERKHVPPPAKNSDLSKRLMANSEALMRAAAAGSFSRPKPNPDAIVIKRLIPAQRGKWRMFKQEVEEADRRMGPDSA